MPAAKRARVDTSNPATPMSAAAPLPVSNGAAACVTPLSLTAAPLQLDISPILSKENKSTKYVYKNELGGVYRFFLIKMAPHSRNHDKYTAVF